MQSVKRVFRAALAASAGLLLIFILAGCNPPRRLPAVPPGEWTGHLGGANRSPYAGETVTPAFEIEWRKEIGRGVAAPVQVHGDVVVAATTSRTIVVLNATSGMQYWSRSFRSPIAGAPLKHGDRVFLGTGDRERKMHAVEITRGRGIWSREVGPIRVEPILADDRLIVVADDGTVRALATDDGRVLWSAHIRGVPAAPPVPWSSHVLMATSADTLYRITTATGEITARRAIPGTVSAPPLLDGDRIVLPFQSGRLAGYGLPALDSLWSVDLGAPIQAAPVTANNTMFVLTRDAVVWQISKNGAAHRIAALGGAATGALTAIRDRLLVGRLDGVLFLLDLDGNTLWQHDFEDSIVAPVAVHEGNLFVALLRGDLIKLQ